jgi:hypothetical protein
MCYFRSRTSARANLDQRRHQIHRMGGVCFDRPRIQRDVLSTDRETLRGSERAANRCIARCILSRSRMFAPGQGRLWPPG